MKRIAILRHGQTLADLPTAAYMEKGSLAEGAFAFVNGFR